MTPLRIAAIIAAASVLLGAGYKDALAQAGGSLVPAPQGIGQPQPPIGGPLAPPSTPPSPTASAPAIPTSAGPVPSASPAQGSSVTSPGATDRDSVVLENADSLAQTHPGQWVARGNVRARYNDYLLAADRLDMDTDSEEATFTGDVVLHAPSGETVYGGPNGVLRVNLDNNTYEIADARTSIPPRALQIGITEPVFVYGGVITGRPGFIDARNGTFTTCDFPDPHYYFDAGDVYVIPGKRLVAKRVTLYRRHRALFTWPYIVVPLDRRFARQTLAPQLGQSEAEGYYAKFAIGYLLAKDLPGVFRLDLMQKKGIGNGFDQSYGNPKNPRRGSGDLSFYELKDQSTGIYNATGTLNHTQQFGTVNFALNSQFQSNSYQAAAGSSNAYSTQLSLNRNVGDLNDTFLANLSASNYGLGASDTITSSFNQVFRPTTAESLTTRFDYSDFLTNYTGAARSQNGTLTSNVEYDERDKLFDWKLVGTKYDQVYSSSTNTFFGGLERLPELQFNTDPQRFPLLRHFLPNLGKVTLDLGEYDEPTTHTESDRIDMAVNTGSNTHLIGGRTSLSYLDSYDQRFYGDGAAQYVLTQQSAVNYKMGSRSTASLSYNYLRPYGFTPFQFDFSGATNLAALNASYQDSPHLQTTVSTGYDFNAAGETQFGTPTPWQNLSVQTLFKPSRSFGNRLTTTYDFNHGQLLDATDNFVINGRDGFQFAVGSRYDPQLHEFANINGTLDFPIILDHREDSGYRIQAVTSFNGFTHQYEYKGLALTRSWHDWEATVIYQDSTLGVQPGPMITFNLSLKAFPSYQPFATGQFGQAIDTGLGTVF